MKIYTKNKILKKEPIEVLKGNTLFNYTIKFAKIERVYPEKGKSYEILHIHMNLIGNGHSGYFPLFGTQYFNYFMRNIGIKRGEGTKDLKGKDLSVLVSPDKKILGLAVNRE